MMRIAKFVGGARYEEIVSKFAQIGHEGVALSGRALFHGGYLAGF